MIINRRYGVAETTALAATKQVSTVPQLQNALTEIYASSSGLGIIEIIGDIVLTAPIKLKSFIASNSLPKEIIIKAIGGAKLLNGNVENPGLFDWNEVNNTNAPVFDFEDALGFSTGVFVASELPVIKYTFVDLSINSLNAAPFGALIGVGLGEFGGIAGTVSCQNIKISNVWHLVGAYGTMVGAFANKVIGYNYNFDGVSIGIDNTNCLVTRTSLNTEYFGLISGSFQNIGLISIADVGLAKTDFEINDNNQFNYNYIGAVAPKIIITTPVNGAGAYTNGSGNTIVGCKIQWNNLDAGNDGGFSLISCSDYNTIVPSTIIPASSSDTAFTLVAPAYVTNAASAFLENSSAIRASWCKYTNGGGELISALNLDDSSNYTVTWDLSIRFQVSGAVNSYRIIANVKVSALGIPTIVGSSTVWANEETAGVISGIIPGTGLGTVFIAPVSSSGKIMVSCTVTMDGFRAFA